MVVCEGGPSLNGALLDHDLVDEWDAHAVPLLAGGAAARAVVGAPPTAPGSDSTACWRATASCSAAGSATADPGTADGSTRRGRGSLRPPTGGSATDGTARGRTVRATGEASTRVAGAWSAALVGSVLAGGPAAAATAPGAPTGVSVVAG